MSTVVPPLAAAERAGAELAGADASGAAAWVRLAVVVVTVETTRPVDVLALGVDLPEPEAVDEAVLVADVAACVTDVAGAAGCVAGCAGAAVGAGVAACATVVVAPLTAEVTAPGTWVTVEGSARASARPPSEASASKVHKLAHRNRFISGQGTHKTGAETRLEQI
ncbi:MAG: hypothetical protein JO156_02080 [Solirubrobacterales bacterium]|nr:hypothetical protein [Solirubrobacterales bacterium]